MGSKSDRDLTTITNVVIQASANHVVVDLSWNASTSSNVTGYNLYRTPDGTTWNKDQCKPDRIHPLCGLHRGQWEHLLLRGHGGRHLRA
jgi:hypothetical protein